MIIPHPLLGPRDAAEFTYYGDASLLDRPAGKGRNVLRRFYEYGYLRRNPAGIHHELWFHEYGDRSWLVVTRNTVTHEIIEARLASEVAKQKRRRK